MGLSFHYSGKISNPDLLPDLIEDVQDIVKTFEWRYYIKESHFPPDSFAKPEYNDKIYGINFTPPECETIQFCFLSNGRMSGAPNLEFFGNSDNEDYKKYLYMLSVKTQFAGIEVHKKVMHLFKYISEKYLTDFKLSDEGLYWGEWDEQILIDKFKEYTQLLDNFGILIECTPISKGEDIVDYMEKLIEKMRKKPKEE